MGAGHLVGVRFSVPCLILSVKGRVFLKEKLVLVQLVPPRSAEGGCGCRKVRTVFAA